MQKEPYRPLRTVLNSQGVMTFLLKPLTAGDGNYVLTCFGTEEIDNLSLNGYISAFDHSTRICLCLALILVPVVFLKKITRKKPTDIILNSISVMLEQGCSGYISKWSKWISGVRLFTGIILSNIYKGDNITSLIAPPAMTKLERFDQIFRQNVSFFISFQFLNMFLHAGDSVVNYKDRTITKLEEVAEVVGKKVITDRVYKSLNGNSGNGTNDVMRTVFRSITWPQRPVEMFKWADSKSYLPLLAKFRREAYIGHRMGIFAMSQMLRNILLRKGGSKKEVSVSKESFSRVGRTWQLQRVPVSSTYLFMRVHMLWQSGLMDA